MNYFSIHLETKTAILFIYTVCKVITSFVCKTIAQYYVLVTKNGNYNTHVQFSIGLSIEYHSHDYRMIDDVFLSASIPSL